MTFREAIQIQIAALQKIYDNMEGLRDIADHDEKKHFNFLRRNLPDLWYQMQQVDNNLSEESAAYPCKGNYSVEINTATIL